MRGSNSRRLLVGNIHVLYNPNRGEVKLGQIRFLASKAQILSQKWGNAPVILAGDFNSTPQSGIYKFLSSSELNIKLYDRNELSGQKHCRPAHVLDREKEAVGSFISQDGYFSFFKLLILYPKLQHKMARAIYIIQKRHESAGIIYNSSKPIFMKEYSCANYRKSNQQKEGQGTFSVSNSRRNNCYFGNNRSEQK
ncbi:Carbon catabolite repressor protein 4 3, variant 3 [Lathyrus oleraceus]|uniref:Carbon catabolite repressor protein 4 3, variant 3 n=1 Tax=Pisum sativum TaxID=3888 RepID=A0A9D4ZS50_PEA|nr:Carbon catabolite repressor protein 4 3, variant 3 [Pisum sativum]